MTARVGVFVGTRADLSPLVPVLRALADGPLFMATAVSYDQPTLTAELARRDLALPVTAVGPLAVGTTPAELARVGAAVSAGTARWLDEQQVDVLVVLGDRWELLYAVPPAVVLGVRVVHLHGGEITEGALDDRVRHALTKLADQHAVATADALGIVAQLGEEPARMHRTGAPGLDLLAGATPLDDAAWHQLIGRVPTRPIALVTVHPATAADDEDPATLARSVLDGALRACATVIVTHPGPDPGREAILDVLAATTDPAVVVVPSLGRDYPRVLASVDVVVGNSSSGVIEAATAGVPAVDVGARQAGRDRAPSVVHAPVDAAEIADAVRAVLGTVVEEGSNPYGDGTAGARIAEVVRAAPAVSRRKPFVKAAVR